MKAEIVHVYPIGDLREHVTIGYPKRQCWCEPEIDEGNGCIVVVHNSLDGREDFETGRRKPS
jgi:hypothetical protein